VEKMAKVAADPKDKWKWPGAKLADGSVADYFSSNIGGWLALRANTPTRVRPG
jgi:hypothetical protein